MLSNRIKSMPAFVFVTLVAITLSTGQPASAQDNSQGRYRPDGRQIAADIARMFGERLLEVRTYDPQPQESAFSAATVFYPLTLSFAPPIGAVVLMPAYGTDAESYAWWGPMLASFGYAVMIIDTNQPNDGFDARKQAVLAAVEFLKNQNSQPDSPIAGKVDTDKVAVIGHSQGGGASLQAAVEMGDQLDAVVALLPYCCDLGQSFSGDLTGLAAPALILATAQDSIAVPADHARALYDSIGNATSKVYLEFAEGDHMMATNDGSELITMGRYAMAFLKRHLDDQAQYEAALYGEQDAQYSAKFSRYDTSR